MKGTGNRGQGTEGRGQGPQRLRRFGPIIAACCLLPLISVPVLSDPYPLRPTPFKVQDSPLPDPEAFYSAVRENLARAERATHLYKYKERRTDIHTNPFGKLGTDGSSLFEVYPSPNRRLVYRRLVERDGKPTSPADLAEQDREYRTRVATVLRENASRTSDQRQFLEQESESARQRRQRAIEDVIDTLDFQVKGRATHSGVAAIVIAFAPKPNARPATRQGRTAQKFAGTVWVDEAAAEVMRVEARSIDDITYGYGLVARLGEGTTATVTRAHVGNKLWMPTRLTLTGRGRAILFRSLVIDYAIDWFDYRRLPEESLAPFLDARVEGQTGGRPE